MAGFLDVILRGLILAAQAVAVGGVCFLLLVLRPFGSRPVPDLVTRARSLGLIALGALVLAIGQTLALASELYVLLHDAVWPLMAAVQTLYVQVSLVRILAGVALAACALQLRREPEERRGLWAAIGLLAATIVAAAPWTSHAAARLESRGPLLLLDGAHQVAAMAWVGGLVHLIAAAIARGPRPWPVALLQRFSNLALTSVVVLVAAGVGLSIYYVDDVSALVGTAYGLMVMTKVVMLAGLLVLGALNSRAIRRMDGRVEADQVTMRRFVEVEVGLGLTVLFAAASLTSLPPAVDLTHDRATLAEVAGRFTPRMPTLRSPSIDEMPIDDPDAPRTDADRAWSEFNHHVSGLLVLVMGLLAILHASGHARWARHWPLVFLALAAFMMVRSDPGSWPLGPEGFWEGWLVATVMQHRIFTVLVVAFGIFEWMVRTGRMRSRRAALIFPLLCALGGGLLLTHSHAAQNLKDEFLLEVTHTPLGVLAMMIGWTRWLELRLPEGRQRLPRGIWAIGLALIGVLLIFYRES
ncbi:MAG TPA: CopD family protein [Methylomirabilota bacterium]|nr:CopD family protein [Methylomirabilota bacterium]